jgi:4-amino-4-deoxy-L-arabinose transferase-like glycosyltransferase
MAQNPSRAENTAVSTARLNAAWPYAAIFLFALVIRLVYLYEIIDEPIISILLGDAESYDAWAREIVQAGWIGDRTFYQAPFYPYFLALLYTLGGRDFILVRLAQILIGSASCVLLASAGARFFNKKTGLVAGGLLALYAPAVFFDLLVQKAILGMFFMCLLLFLLSRTTGQRDSQRQPGTWLLIGACLACFALVRENALVLIPAVGVWMIIVFRNDSWQRSIVKGLLLGIGLCLVFFPVTLRNYVVGGEFVLTTSQLGPNFYIGNNRSATGFYEPLVEGHSDWKFERSDAKELAEAALGEELTPNQISDYWLSKAIKDIRQNPLGWLRLMGKKWLLVWNTTETSDSESIYAHYRFSRLLSLLGQVMPFGVLLPVAILGICLSWQNRKHVWGLVWLWLCFAGSVALFFVFARYRHPMNAITLLFAASGLTCACQLLFEKRFKPLALGVLTAIPFAVCANWPLVSRTKMEAPTHFNIGYEMERRNELDVAKDAYLLSVAIDSNTLAYNNLGMVAMKQDQPEEAMHYFSEAVKTKPTNWRARVNLGIVLAQMGRKAEAIEQYREVVRHEPDYNPSLYYNIACYYAVEGQVIRGMEWLEKAVSHGYDNWELIQTDPDLQNLRGLPEYRDLFSRQGSFLD